MSIGGGPEFATMRPEERPAPSVDRDSSRPITRPSTPTPRPTTQGVAGDGMLVIVYGDDSDPSVAETAVLRSFRRPPGGIRVMTAESLGLAGGDHAAVQSAVQGDFAALADLVRSQGGEFIFVGNLTSIARAAPRGPMFSGSAQFELRMYSVSTGEVLRSDIFRIGMAGQPAKMGTSESGARAVAADAAATLGAVAARRWLARAVR